MYLVLQRYSKGMLASAEKMHGRLSFGNPSMDTTDT